MRQADLAWARPTPTTDQTGMADRMVWRAKWAGAHEWLAVRQGIGHRVDAGDVERFGKGETREYHIGC